MDAQGHRREGDVVAQERNETTYCTRHKDTPTKLLCGRCDTPVCPKCMVHGPVGVRCPDCGKPTALPIYQVSTPLLLRAIAASIVIGIAGGVALLVIRALIFGLFYVIASAGLGYVVSEGTSYAANRKRGRTLAIVATAGALVGELLIVALLISAVGGLTLFDLIGVGLAPFVAFVRLKQP